MDKIQQMNFSQPVWLLLLFIIPVVSFFYSKYLRTRTTAFKINGVSQVNDEMYSSISPLDYLFMIRMLVVAFIIIGLADPQLVSKTKIRSPVSETSIMLTLDVSKSMLIEDLKPNRIEALKDVLTSFISMRSQDKMGITLYGGESVYWCPLTKDYPLLLNRLNKMEQSDLSDGTAIGLGLATSINALKKIKTKNKVIILLTDGENNAGFIDPPTAAKFAKRLNITIYCVGIGSTGTALMPLMGLDGKKYYQKIKVTLNEDALKQIAKISGGLYFRATDALALRKVYTAINKLETKKVKMLSRTSSTSDKYIVIGIALSTLFVELGLRFTLLRTWPA